MENRLPDNGKGFAKMTKKNDFLLTRMAESRELTFSFEIQRWRQFDCQNITIIYRKHHLVAET